MYESQSICKKPKILWFLDNNLGICLNKLFQENGLKTILFLCLAPLLIYSTIQLGLIHSLQCWGFFVYRIWPWIYRFLFWFSIWFTWRSKGSKIRLCLMLTNKIDYYLCVGKTNRVFRFFILIDCRKNFSDKFSYVHIKCDNGQ